MSENDISNQVIGLALKVHRRLGPGLLESVYVECLFHELVQSNIQVEKQKGLPLTYDDTRLDCGFRIDLLVEKKVVVEVKSVEAMNEIYFAQVLTYLRLSECKLGLLINFNVVLLKDGIKRVVNNL